LVNVGPVKIRSSTGEEVICVVAIEIVRRAYTQALRLVSVSRGNCSGGIGGAIAAVRSQRNQHRLPAV
jgi:hypothetical protein